MRSNIGSSPLLALSIAGLLFVGNAWQVRAEDGCSNESLRGSYAIQGTGTVMSGPFAGPAAFVGILRFDGVAHLEGNLTQRVNTCDPQEFDPNESFTKSAGILPVTELGLSLGLSA